MATKIVTKNSSTASAVPTASDLVQGELAVNVADKRLFTENNAGAIVELGTNPSALTVAGEITANGGIALGDNDKATFGSGDDLQLYHDGSNSYIDDTATGHLFIRSNGDGIYLRSNTNEEIAHFNVNGSVKAYYDNSLKLATTSTGIDVTGTATMDGLTVDGAATITANLDVGADNGLGGKLSIQTSSYGVLQDMRTLVAGGINPYLTISSSADGITFEENGSQYKSLMFKTGATERMRIAADGSLSTPTLGTSNVRFGVNAGNSIASGGNYNVVVGDEAGTAITTGNDNVAVGSGALTANTTGAGSVAVGKNSMYNNTTAIDNVAVGMNALFTNTTGTANVAVGRNALLANTTASNNTSVGYLSLTANTTGASNVAVGTNSLTANTTGSDNVSFGHQAMQTNTTGGSNSAFGRYALLNNSTASFNTAVGRSALQETTTGANNVGVGYRALYLNTTGNTNTAVGYQAGQAITTSIQNNLFGAQSGYNLTTGNRNTFIGSYNGYSVTTGSGNTFIGNSGSNDSAGTGYYMTTGNDNTIIGGFTGNQGGLDIRTSSNNIVLSDGDGNPRGYYHGGLSSPSWFFNTPTQNQWAVNVQNTHNSSPYGLNVQFTGAIPNNTSNKFITCQDGNAERLIIYSNGNVVNINNSYGAISDVKLKENIIDASSQWEDIKALTVRKYSMKAENLDAPNMLGVIAQEVEAAGMGGLVYESPDLDSDMTDLGTVTKQVNYSILYMKAVKALQEAMNRIESLEERITTLEG